MCPIQPVLLFASWRESTTNHTDIQLQQIFAIPGKFWTVPNRSYPAIHRTHRYALSRFHHAWLAAWQDCRPACLMLQLAWRWCRRLSNHCVCLGQWNWSSTHSSVASPRHLIASHLVVAAAPCYLLPFDLDCITHQATLVSRQTSQTLNLLTYINFRA